MSFVFFFQSASVSLKPDRHVIGLCDRISCGSEKLILNKLKMCHIVLSVTVAVKTLKILQFMVLTF